MSNGSPSCRYTAREMHAAEALSCGFVSRVLDDKDAVVDAAIETATTIAAKSPVAVEGTKRNLCYRSVDASFVYARRTESRGLTPAACFAFSAVIIALTKASHMSPRGMLRCYKPSTSRRACKPSPRSKYRDSTLLTTPVKFKRRRRQHAKDPLM